MNKTVHGTMRNTPYKLVFGQPPHSSIFPGVQSTSVNEEDVQDLLIKDDAEEDGGDTSDDTKADNDSDSCETVPNSALATMLKHRHLRQKADKHYRTNVERMQLKYSKAKNKKMLTFCPVPITAYLEKQLAALIKPKSTHLTILVMKTQNRKGVQIVVSLRLLMPCCCAVV